MNNVIEAVMDYLSDEQLAKWALLGDANMDVPPVLTVLVDRMAQAIKLAIRQDREMQTVKPDR